MEADETASKTSAGKSMTAMKTDNSRTTAPQNGEKCQKEERIQRDRLMTLLASIRPADQTAVEEAERRWNSIAKPIRSLGILEEDLTRIAGIRRSAEHICVNRPALVVMCADHGVVAEGVSQTGQEVTRIVAENFTTGHTCTSIFCKKSGTDLFPVDIGMLGETPGEEVLRPGVLLNRKIREGSGNIAREPAMSEAECVCALLSAIDLVGGLKRMGYQILATGEMGIGNTTPSSAMAAALLGLSPEEVTGRGAGLSDQGLKKKRAAVRAAIKRFERTDPNRRRPLLRTDTSTEADAPAEAVDGASAERVSEAFATESGREAFRILTEVGGLDLAGMTGLYLGGAIYRLPVLIDGFISSVAALCAVRLCPDVRDYLIATHVSSEPAGQAVMKELGFSAPLHCGMHLGEGSGAAAFLPLLQMAGDVYESMSTFEEIRVDSYVDYEEKAESGPANRQERNTVREEEQA